ncbi:hypothetical protein ABT147_35910 [Streptomyces sp. NPDC001868]|uniref:hypothetical protein n=1 Tax=Streptomyces sp. NPDC001868 TaxID=3154401 RepID=UPI00331A132F
MGNSRADTACFNRGYAVRSIDATKPPPDHQPDKGPRDDDADEHQCDRKIPSSARCITALQQVSGVLRSDPLFGLLFLLLAQLRELMRQIGRTIDEWHDLRGSGDDEPSDK